MRIRKAKKEDICAINKLSDELHFHMAKTYGLRISKEDLEEEHTTLNDLKNENIYIAEINGKIIGCISFNKKLSYDEWKGKYIELYHIIVNKRYRHKGVGKKLIELIKEQAKKRKVSISADTGFNNKKAILFYRKNGFKPLNMELIWRTK